MTKGLLLPLVSALDLARRWPSLLAWIVLIALSAAMRAFGSQFYQDTSASNFLWLNIFLLRLGPIAADAAVIFFLARTILVAETGSRRPLYLRCLGLFLLMVVVEWLITSVGTVAIFSGAPSPFMMTYGAVLVGSFAAIVTFPILVRSFAATAGIEQPGLGDVWPFVFDQGRSVLVWFALCEVLFTGLMVFTFLNLLPSGEANALPGNIVQSTITGTGNLLMYMLAIVAARMAAPSGRRMAEAFE